MKYYDLKVLCHTAESRQWDKLNEESNEPCPRDLMVKRPLMVNAEMVESFMPDKDVRCTEVIMVGGENSYVIVKTFEKFKEMVLTKQYIEI